MAPQRLTTEQCLLLQRFYDEELSAAESVQAEQLLERSGTARVFVRALEELGVAAQASHELVWERARPHLPSASDISQLAEIARENEQILAEPLDDLSGLLTRVYDGEADPAEAAWARALLSQRPDARAFMDELEAAAKNLREASEQAAEDVDFSDFWAKVSAGIDAEKPAARPTHSPARPAFNADDHLMLLHRYADGETSAEERARVEGWLRAEEPEVRGYLDALKEMKLGVSVAVDTLTDKAPLRDIWTGVAEALDAQAEPASAQDKTPAGGTISLSEARQKRRGGWMREYRQAIFGAVAAAVVLLGTLGLFKDQIFGPSERVVVEKTVEKRVVVVESVEYSPGSSVRIDGPTKQVNMAKEDNAEGEESEPTVIWLFDESDESEGVLLDDLELDDLDDLDEQPAEKERSPGQPAEDAGPDLNPRGQPI